MKNNYFLITACVLLFSSISYGQAAKFFLDFEGTNPLSNLPSGITNVNGTNTVRVKNATDYSPISNAVQSDGASGNELFLDYHGYLKMNLNVSNGYSVALDYRKSPEDADWYLGFLTQIGNNAGSNSIERIKLMRYWEGSLEFNGSESSWQGVNMETETHIVITVSVAGDVKIYQNNIEILNITNATSGKNLTSWTAASLLLSFNGGSYDGTNVTPEPDYTFASRDTRAFVDNIALFERELSAAEVTLLFNNGNNTLSVEKNKSITNVGMYPNPVNRDTEFVKFSSADVKSVNIYNILGAKVMSSEVLDYAVNISTLTSGTYIINCLNSENQKLDSVKLIKI